MKTPQFEQRLAALYDTAEKEKEAAKAQIQAAELACEHAEDQETAERMKTEAKRAYTAALTDADAMLNAARSSLRAELIEDVRKRSLADPDAVIPAAVSWHPEIWQQWQTVTVKALQCCGSLYHMCAARCVRLPATVTTQNMMHWSRSSNGARAT